MHRFKCFALVPVFALVVFAHSDRAAAQSNVDACVQRCLALHNCRADLPRAPNDVTCRVQLPECRRVCTENPNADPLPPGR